MMNKIDISPEAVERLAMDHDTVADQSERFVMGHSHHWKTARVLRKLSARVEELERELHDIKDAPLAFLLEHGKGE